MESWSDDLEHAKPALELLEQLCICVNVPFDLTQARKMLSRSARPGTDDWCSTVRHAGVDLGIAWRSFEAEVTDAIVGVGPRHPLLVWTDIQRPDGWILITERRGRQVKAATGHDPSGRWISIRELESNLADTAKVVWWAADPSTPLEWLAGGSGGASPFSRLTKLLSAEREDVRVVMVFALGTGLLTLATPIAVQALVNNVAFGTLLQPVVVLTLALVLGLALSSALTALEVYVVEILQRRLFVRVTGDLAHRLPRVKVSAYDTAHGPELVNRYFDVFTVHKATATLLLDGLDLVLRTSVGLLLLAFYHPILLAFDLVLVVSLFFVLWFLGRGGQATAVKESKAKYAVAAWLETIAARPTAFKSPAAQIMARDRVDQLARDFLKTRETHFRVVFRQTIGSLAVQTIASAAVLGIGGWLVIRGQLTLGQLVAAELVVTAVVASFAKMGKQVESFYDLLAGIDKLGKLADLPMERHDGEAGRAASEPGGADLELERVTIGAGKRGPIVKDANLHLKCGTETAILASADVGLEYVSDALLALRPTSNGWIRLNGTDYRDLSFDDLRRRVTVAGPNETIPGSILQNVHMGRVYVDNTDIRRALQSVGLLDEVSALPDGLQTNLTLDGRPLSDAELRLLMLARATIGPPELMIVDRVLDALDPATVDRVLEGLRAMEGKWTLLVLSRRPEIVARFDSKYRIDNGTLAPMEASA